MRLRFGVKLGSPITALVIGLRVLPLVIQDRIAALSYVYPSVNHKTDLRVTIESLFYGRFGDEVNG